MPAGTPSAGGAIVTPSPRFPVFLWKERFNIAIAQIDSQHQHLPGLINGLIFHILALMLRDHVRT
jgi:hypothetical protein